MWIDRILSTMFVVTGTIDDGFVGIESLSFEVAHGALMVDKGCSRSEASSFLQPNT